MLFGAEGVVTAGMYRQAAELPVCSTGITLRRKIYVGLYGLYVSPRQLNNRNPPHPAASVSKATQQQVHSGSEDGKQLEVIAVIIKHAAANPVVYNNLFMSLLFVFHHLNGNIGGGSACMAIIIFF